MTRKGERPFQPLFGSDVYSLLFELIDRDIEEKIKTLSDDIKFLAPYIVIDNISIDTNPDRNSVKIQLRFRVTEQEANQQIILFIDSEGSLFRIGLNYEESKIRFSTKRCILLVEILVSLEKT